MGVPALATANVSSYATPMRSLADIPGALLRMAVGLLPVIALTTLQGFDVDVNNASSMGLLLSSDGITSGPFAATAAFAAVRRPRLASAVVFAVARQVGFARRLTPSKFDETQRIFPSAVFWRFAAVDPPSAAGLPSLAPAVLPTSVLRVGLIFRAIVGAISFELDLACLAALLGKIMMSQDVRFS